METARIFNIERCSTEDGPGIRTTVFLKGCQLRCRWCANPESQEKRRQILFKAVKCIGCGRCQSACPSNAIVYMPEFGMISDPEKCTLCGKCIHACYQEARVLQGEDYTSDELMEILKRMPFTMKSPAEELRSAEENPCFIRLLYGNAQGRSMKKAGQF